MLHELLLWVGHSRPTRSSAINVSLGYSLARSAIFSLASSMTKAELIQHNAERLRDLHNAVHSTYELRREGASQEARWREACRRFHQDWDQLAFPGGITEGMRRLVANDPGAVESAVVFLEVDPFFFRSGYIKEELLERLTWASLDQDQKCRLRQVILARVRDPKAGREFRRYCRLAPFVTDPAFEQEIAKLAGPSGAKPKRAQWVIEHLRQGVPKRKA